MNEAREIRDRVLRAVSEKAFNDIVKASRRVKNWSTDKIFRLDINKKRVMFFVDASKVLKDTKKLDIVLHDGKGTNKYHIGEKVIVIGGMSTITSQRLRTEKDPKNIHLMFAKMMEYAKSTFIHEFTHYLDFEKRDMDNMNLKTRAISKSSDPNDPSNTEYFNSPEEFNAYYQQGAHRMEELLRELKKDPTLIDYVLRYIPPDVNYFIKKEFDKGYKYKIWAIEWLRVLTPKNRRKFIKRLVPLHKRITRAIGSVK